MVALAQHNSKIDVAPPRMKESGGDSLSEIHSEDVYRPALLACLVGALPAFISGGLAGVVGLVSGAALALVSLRTLELTVRRLFRPDVPLVGTWFGVLIALKFLMLAVVLTGAVWLASHRAINLYAIVAGVALVHGVILMHAVEAWLREALPPYSRPHGSPDLGTG
jgi:hypothetical protein